MSVLINKQFVAGAVAARKSLTELIKPEPTFEGLLRLETDPRGESYDEALAARVADPLWLLARQWQFREFDGEDAGSPLAVHYRLQGTPLLGWAAGAAPGDDAFTALGGAPLEPLVEAEAVLTDPQGHARANAEAGQMLVRLLDDAGVDASPVRSAFPGVAAPPADMLSDPAGTLWHLVLAGRSIDAQALATACAPLRVDGALPALPAPLLAAGLLADALPALNEWLRWMDDFIFEPAGGAPNAAWNPARQEYAFELAAGRGAAERLRLDADEYVDGRIDAHDFDLRDANRTLMPGQAGTLDDAADRESFPTPVQYPGMPASRYWEFEDAAVNFARLDAASMDMVRMMVAEYALVHGNDWFMVPARVRAGGLYRVAALRVTDSFGRVTDVQPVAAVDGADWRLHGLTRTDAAAIDSGWLFIPPPLSDTLEGNPLEEVAFARDEMANLAWAIEKRVQGTSGEPLDRSLEDQRYAIRQQPSVAGSDARVLYRLMTPVASHWLPLLPVRRQGDLGLDIQLERGGMKRFYRRDDAARAQDPAYAAFLTRLDDTAALPGSFVEKLASTDPDIAIYAFHPRGRVLRNNLALPVNEDGLRIEEEELARSGFIVERRFQYARSADGRAWLWVGRRKRVGKGEAASGLAFDLRVVAGSR